MDEIYFIALIFTRWASPIESPGGPRSGTQQGEPQASICCVTCPPSRSALHMKASTRAKFRYKRLARLVARNPLLLSALPETVFDDNFTFIFDAIQPGFHCLKRFLLQQTRLYV